MSQILSGYVASVTFSENGYTENGNLFLMIMFIFFVSVKVDLLLPVDVDIGSCRKTYFLNIKTKVKFVYENYNEEFLENVIPMLSSLAESHAKLSNML